jgi:phosphoglycolate phosphatase-like HAD superfamily hydrolase
MPRLSAGGQSRDIDLVIFDKDGTLVDFDRLWAGKLKAGIDAVMAAAGPSPALEAALCATLGIEPASMRVIPESPLAVATLPKLMLACAVVLHQHGRPWHAAETLAREVFHPVIQEPPRPDDLTPIGDVKGLMTRLAQGGCRIAIFTSDDRHATEVSLPMLGVAGLVEAMVCGDDPITGKPAGDGIIHLARRLGVDPTRVLMIGDSVTDMKAAMAAGAGWRLAVRSGTGDAASLAGAADAVIDTIHDLAPL